MPSPSLPDCHEPMERARSGPVPVHDVVTALRCSAIPIWLLLCIVGTWLWGGFVTLGLVLLTWKAAAKYG
jgi:hypothetical protein